MQACTFHLLSLALMTVEVRASMTTSSIKHLNSPILLHIFEQMMLYIYMLHLEDLLVSQRLISC